MISMLNKDRAELSTRVARLEEYIKTIPDTQSAINGRIEAVERRASGNAAGMYVLEKKLDESGKVDITTLEKRVEDYRKESASRHTELAQKFESLTEAAPGVSVGRRND